MKNILYFFACTFIMNSCLKQDPLTFEIPLLLERSEKLQYFNEWSEVRNQYSDLQYAIKHKPNSIEAYIRLANLFIAEARVTGEHGHYYNAALKTIDWALNQKVITKEQQFLALCAKANVQLSLHSFKEALHTSELALSLNPYNAQIYGSLVDAFVELGDYAKAVETADKMISIRPDLRSYSRVSYLREIYGMPDYAIHAMTLAVEAGSPGSEEKSWAALQLAQLYLRYNKFKESENILNQLLEERPDYPFAKATLAEVYFRLGNSAKAEIELKEACKIIPEVGFYVQLAELYKQENRDTELKSTLKEIIAMLEDDTKHGHNMSLEYANIYLNFYNDPDAALKYLQPDLIMRPENIDINRMLSKIYLAKKDRIKAQDCLQKATRTHSKHPELDEIRNELAQL